MDTFCFHRSSTIFHILSLKLKFSKLNMKSLSCLLEVKIAEITVKLLCHSLVENPCPEFRRFPSIWARARPQEVFRLSTILLPCRTEAYFWPYCALARISPKIVWLVARWQMSQSGPIILYWYFYSIFLVFCSLWYSEERQLYFINCACLRNGKDWQQSLLHEKKNMFSAQHRGHQLFLHVLLLLCGDVTDLSWGVWQTFQLSLTFFTFDLVSRVAKAVRVTFVMSGMLTIMNISSMKCISRHTEFFLLLLMLTIWTFWEETKLLWVSMVDLHFMTEIIREKKERKTLWNWFLTPILKRKLSPIGTNCPFCSDQSTALTFGCNFTYFYYIKLCTV